MIRKYISYTILSSLCCILLVIPSGGGAGDSTPITNDVFYQDIFDDTTLKTFLLKRMANDMGSTDPPFYDAGNPYAAQTANMPKGLFLHTDNAEDLDNLFQVIGKRIQLRLVK
jgi:hypothetical protein